MILIFSALVLTISTSIDYLLILSLLFSTTKNKNEKRKIYVGQLLASLLLILISFAMSRIASLLPADWMIGLLGLFPIFLGLHLLFEKEEEAEISNQAIGTLSVLLLSLASGGDNIGIFAPYFTTLTLLETLLISGIVVIGTGLICFVAERFGNLRIVSEFVERYEAIILPTVFISLGIYLLFDLGTIEYFLNFVF